MIDDLAEQLGCLTIGKTGGQHHSLLGDPRAGVLPWPETQHIIQEIVVAALAIPHLPAHEPDPAEACEQVQWASFVPLYPRVSFVQQVILDSPARLLQQILTSLVYSLCH